MASVAAAGDSVKTKRDRATMRSVAFAAGGGTLIEFYDFSVYGYLAVILSPLFFPAADSTISLLATLAVFGTAYFMRPFGSIVFGHIGDRLGRKSALLATLVCMGAASAAMGLLPAYDSVGIWAPVLLTLARLLQGFSAGGENGGAATFISESAPVGKKGLYGSVIGIGGTAGFAVAAAVVGSISILLVENQMAEWGWRLPFLVSVPLTLFCFWIRRHVAESLEHPGKQKQNFLRIPVLRLFRAQIRPVLQVIALSVAVNGGSYFGFTYLSIHLTERLSYSATLVYWVAAVAIGMSAVLMPIAGMLADKIGNLPVASIGLSGFILFTGPAMVLMEYGIWWAGVAFFVIMANSAFLQVAVFTVIPQNFDAEHRYTGVAFSYNVGVMIAGGFAPFLCVWLVESTGFILSPTLFVAAVSALGLVGVCWMRRTKHADQMQGRQLS